MSPKKTAGAVGRPRDPDVERSILEATQDLLIENGYPGTTIAAVASRARCGKSAIYRRWGSKPELVVAAVRAAQKPADVPDTGELRQDLLDAAMHFADSGDRSGSVLARLLSEIGRDRELYTAAHRVIGGPPVAALTSVIERWIARGVLSPDLPVSLIAEIVPTAAFGSIALRQRGLEPHVVQELVDGVILPALHAGPPPRSTQARALDASSVR